MILIDSNIWLYLLDATTPEHDSVKHKLPALLEGEELLMPTVVQMEVMHYVIRRMGAKAEEAMDAFLAMEALVESLTGSITTEAVRLLLAHRGAGIGGRDAALLVMAKRRNAGLATNDKNLAKLAKAVGVDVHNPAQ